MRTRIKKLIPFSGLVALMIIFATIDGKSQDDPPPPPCEEEVVVISGTKMNVNPENPWNYECMGDYTNCTDAWVLGCPEVE